MERRNGETYGHDALGSSFGSWRMQVFRYAHSSIRPQLILMLYQLATGANFSPLAMFRPKEIAQWTRASRPLVDSDILVPEDFAVTWWKWWSRLQPPSRSEAGRPDMLSPTYLMKWDSIRKPGKNGLILVIVALRWWGVASSASEEWRKAVDDVSSAVFCMADAGHMEVIPVKSVKDGGNARRGSKRTADEADLILSGKRKRTTRVRTF